MAGIKINELPDVGRNLSSTDMFELSLAGGTGSRKISGAQLTGGLQPTLVSGTNIKTINGSSVLGSGNLTVGGGFHALIPLKSGENTNAMIVSANPLGTSAFITLRLLAYPFIPNQTFTASSLFINVTTAVAGSLCRVAIYDDLDGYPNNRLFVSSDLDCSTTGIKTAITTQTFNAGTTYWLAFHGGSVASTLNVILNSQSLPIKPNSTTSIANNVYYSLVFSTPTPSTFLANQSYNSASLPYIGITKS